MWTKFGGDCLKTVTCSVDITSGQTDKQTDKSTYLQKMKFLASNKPFWIIGFLEGVDGRVIHQIIHNLGRRIGFRAQI